MELIVRAKLVSITVVTILATTFSCFAGSVEATDKNVQNNESKDNIVIDSAEELDRAITSSKESEVDERYSLNGAFMDADPLAIFEAPADFDSLIAEWYEQNSTNNFESFFKEYIDIDSTVSIDSEIPDSVYAARLKRMVSPINLGYNDIIKRYILVYTNRKTLMSRVLGLSKLYFPMIEQELANAGLPLELKMIPVIESALNPSAVSRMGATGLWQFMYRTGQAYDLEITSFMDERRDPIKSTKAACKYLKDMYAMYNDWSLAIAAYNCGPGNVNKALRRAGEGAKTFWDVYHYLPRETRGYLPAFVASTYAYNYHKAHDIEPIEPNIPILTDTLHIDRLMHFEQISSTIGTPLDIIRSLNPQYKLDIIPATKDKNYVLTIPQSEVTQFILRHNDIVAKDTVYLAEYIKQDTKTGENIIQGNSIQYRIKSGDTLGAIAIKHGVTVSQLMQWNNLKSAHKLSIGQRLDIYR